MNLSLTPTEAAKVYTGAQAKRIFAEHTGDRIAAWAYLMDETPCPKCHTREAHEHGPVAKITGAELVERIGEWEQARYEEAVDRAVYRAECRGY